MNTTNESYRELLSSVLRDGVIAFPRSQMTKELLGLSARFDMNAPVIVSDVRKLSYKFMAAEAIWIVNGDNSVRGIAPYNRNIAAFSDNGVAFFGAYGPKFMEQRQYIIRKLFEDDQTRQAVMTIWRERPDNSRDIPCTVSLGWVIRGGVIHCFVNMRSSDLWLGLPYDIFNFTAMTMDIRNLYNKGMDQSVLLGNLYWSANSVHLYEQHFENAEQIVLEESESVFIPTSIKQDYSAFMESLIAIRDDPGSEHDWIRSSLS